MSRKIDELDLGSLSNAKRYEPDPYWSCPNCGSNCWGSVERSDGVRIYMCQGSTVVGNPFHTVPGCGHYFLMPEEAHDE